MSARGFLLDLSFLHFFFQDPDDDDDDPVSGNGLVEFAIAENNGGMFSLLLWTRSQQAMASIGKSV